MNYVESTLNDIALSNICDINPAREIHIQNVRGF